MSYQFLSYTLGCVAVLLLFLLLAWKTPSQKGPALSFRVGEVMAAENHASAYDAFAKELRACGRRSTAAGATELARREKERARKLREILTPAELEKLAWLQGDDLKEPER